MSEELNAGSLYAGITGVILAGGSSSRMKRNKALLPLQGETFIERVYHTVKAVFSEVLVVTNTPEVYSFLPCEKIYDLYPGAGALAGIHAGLSHCTTPHIFVAACDMPFLNEALLRYLAGRAAEGDVVIPENHGGVEPLHAVYSTRCREVMEAHLARGEYRIIDSFAELTVARVTVEEVLRYDPHLLSFRNLNTPQEYLTALQS